jgi:hypothetical protein
MRTASAFVIRVPHGIAIRRTSMVRSNQVWHTYAAAKLLAGGGIERWEDEKFRACFADIISGQWTKHDPYALEPRLEARTSLYRKPNYVYQSCFGTFTC